MDRFILRLPPYYLLALLAFFLRVAALLILKRHLFPEIWEYDTIAINILNGLGYIIKDGNTLKYMYGDPLYAYFSAFVHLLSGRNYVALEMVQIVISSLTVIPIFLIAKKIFSEKTGYIAGLLFAIHPGIIIYATKIHEFTLTVFLISLIAYLVSLNNAKLRENMVIGILVGFGILLRPTLLFFIPCIFVYDFLRLGNIRQIFKRTCFIFIVAFLIISPWLCRGYVLFKRVIFITTTSTELFWRGNNPNASGSSMDIGGKAILEKAPEEFKERLYGLDEIGQYDFYRNEAFNFIESNWSVFFNATLRKFIYFWTFAPQTGLLYSSLWKKLYMCFYFPILVLFVIGMNMAIRESKKQDFAFVVFVLMFIVCISLVQSLYYTEIRHRWAIEPLMMIFSSFAVFGIRDKFIEIYKKR